MAERKTASFALVHFTVAFLVTYAITGSAAMGGAIALIEPMVNTAAFYIHERVWSARVGRSYSNVPLNASAN